MSPTTTSGSTISANATAVDQSAVAPEDIPRLVPGLRNRQFACHLLPFRFARALCGAAARLQRACGAAAAEPSRAGGRLTTTSNGGSATGSSPTRGACLHGRARGGDPRRQARECVWLLEHPPLFTAGTSADPAELFNPLGFPVYEAGRGGRYTYHGPGQRVGYLMLDLEKRGKDIRRFVHALEGWIIATLAELGISAHRAPDASASGSAKARRRRKSPRWASG